MELAEHIRAFPRQPGIYLMRDRRGAVLYVGKAKELRARVAAYFPAGRDPRYQIRLLMRRVASIDYVVTDTEKEALLLEHTLIRKHRPRYNVLFRDDKAFLNIRVTTKHPFPGISLTRRVTADGAAYFGPYTSALACRETIEQITRYFRLRTCNDREFANRARPCIQYQIGRCTAPCVGCVDRDTYARQVEEAIWLLRGRRNALERALQRQMEEASRGERFEEAARLRDLLRDIGKTVEAQKMVRHEVIDRDYVGFASAGERGGIALLEVREGKVIGRAGAAIRLGGDDPSRLIASFLVQYYQPPRRPPSVICLPFAPSHFSDVAAWLTERAQSRVRLLWPRRGTEARLLRLAATNARAYARTQQLADEEWGVLSASCQRALHLPRPPQAIECLDISNWQGKAAIGALVCFVGGVPAKERYRLYRIRSVDQPNDYAMIQEVMTRRLKGDMPRPDLLLVDGGRGQLQVVLRAIEALDCPDLSVAAIAKPQESEPTDKIYLPGRKNPLPLKAGNPVLHLLQRLRDEAHRFGISRTRSRTIATSLRSPLADVSGIGPRRQQLLLTSFGGLEGLRQATIEQLSRLPGITPSIADQVLKIAREVLVDEGMPMGSSGSIAVSIMRHGRPPRPRPAVARYSRLPFTRPPQAVLFDNDGVVLNSEPIIFRATAQVFAGYGIQLTKADIKDGIGAGARYVTDPRTKYGLTDVSVVELMRAREAAFRALAVNRLKPFPDFLSLIVFLRRQRIRTALASSAATDVIQYNLDIAGLNPNLFDAIVDSSKIKNKKPAPDIFLEGAANLGVQPCDCLVIEDAPAGIAAAKNAGMPVVALTTSLPSNYLGEADAVVASLSHIHRGLAALLGVTMEEWYERG